MRLLVIEDDPTVAENIELMVTWRPAPPDPSWGWLTFSHGLASAAFQ
jgi:hypothetical protein